LARKNHHRRSLFDVLLLSWLVYAGAITDWRLLSMSQVVDALKRLERAGDANSQTTRKLVEAADRLAQRIVEQYEARDKYVADIAPQFTRARYSVLNGRLVNAESRYVAENRITALAFALDIADGLLDGIAESMENRNQESRQALSGVENTLRRLQWGH
jgi:hypothetical protein